MILQDALISSKPSPFLLIEHDLSCSAIPLLRHVLSTTLQEEGPKSRTIVLATFLHAPSTFIREDTLAVATGKLIVKDYTDHSRFPDHDQCGDIKYIEEDWMRILQSKNHPIMFHVDSMEMLVFLYGEVAALALLHSLVDRLKVHSGSSRLILCTSSSPTRADASSSRVIPSLMSTSFSSSITYLRLHSPQLFRHISKTFLLSPPTTMDPDPKFYTIFTRFTHRERKEAENLVYGIDSAYDSENEVVVEVIRRTGGGMRKGVDRSLEGITNWNDSRSQPLLVCKLGELESLQSCFGGRKAAEDIDSTSAKASLDPTQNLSFNLSLTEEQQTARAQVPLPYAHTGQHHPSTPSASGPATGGIIYYDPDSADDMDDEDPDEDLDL